MPSLFTTFGKCQVFFENIWKIENWRFLEKILKKKKNQIFLKPFGKNQIFLEKFGKNQIFLEKFGKLEIFGRKSLKLGIF